MTRPTPFRIALIGAVAACLVAAGSTGSLAGTPSPAAAAIAARHENFKAMGAAFKTIKDQLAGSPDKAKILAAAKVIAATGRKQGALFPAGSGPAPGVKTDALPAIWTDRATFDADMKKMIGEADKLVAAAGTGNTDAITAQFKATGATCAACHKQFRADN